ncbi:MAG: serine/threonine protein kinase, partial [Planctomycetes bacterium]|nr:serine/threonine protein kinase [Planctomycetota bacterium]
RCAEALAHAAARGVIHRDVKPGNVLIGPGGAVKLIDWGLGKPAGGDAGLTAEHSVLGTLRYAPPEQFRDARRADQRSDIYALGGTLYELLTGRLPFPGDEWPAVLAAKETGALAPASAANPAVPPCLDRVLARMLAPDPADRYLDYAPLIRDLDGIGLADEQPDPRAFAKPDRERPTPPGPRLRVLLVYDAAKYIPLAQHALFAAGVPHDLATVEDGHDAPAAVARDGPAGWGFDPDAVFLGLTSPTHASLRVLGAVRAAAGRHAPAVVWMSLSPDGAALLNGLDLGTGVWATGFADVEPLGTVLRDVYAAVTGGSSTPR